MNYIIFVGDVLMNDKLKKNVLRMLGMLMHDKTIISI